MGQLFSLFRLLHGPYLAATGTAALIILMIFSTAGTIVRGTLVPAEDLFLSSSWLETAKVNWILCRREQETRFFVNRPDRDGGNNITHLSTRHSTASPDYWLLFHFTSIGESDDR